MKPTAFLFDLNGTMIDDMEYHLHAWSDVLNNDLQAGLSTEQVREQMYGKNDELLVRVLGEGKLTKEEMDRYSMQKELKYQEAYLPQLQLLPGLQAFLDKAAARQIPMAIGSAAIPFNINFILDNLHLQQYFKAVVSADDVAVSKPHPETFLKAASLLQVPPHECVVFEDAPKGVEAALNAGMKAVVLTTMHPQKAFLDYPNVMVFVKDYNDPILEMLF